MKNEMEKVTLDRNFLIREFECDNHNIQQAIQLMDSGLNKSLMKFTKTVTAEMKRSLRANRIAEGVF